MDEGRERVVELLGTDTELASSMGDFLARSTDFDLEFFLEEVDQSDYSLCDWAAALVAFDKWLAERGESSRPFRAMAGYVHCCTLMNARSVPAPGLEVIVIQSLMNYGFDIIQGSQN